LIIRHPEVSVADMDEHVEYEAPRLDVVGSIHDLSELQDRNLGDTDGFAVLGQPIANNSV
jgi:hypothetical protein